MAVTKGDPTARDTAQQAADQQGLLFDDECTPAPEHVGYRGPTACTAAGITYRQLDYWARTGLVEPSVSGQDRPAAADGFRDILVLRVVKRLFDTGISLQQIRSAVLPARARRDRSRPDYLMSDGASVRVHLAG